MVILPFSITLVVMVPLSVRLAKKFGPRRVVRYGWLLGLVGSVMLIYLIEAAQEPSALIWGTVVFAAGMAMIVSQITNFVMSTVDTKDAPEAAGVMSTFQQLSNSLGVAILSAILAIGLTQGMVQNIKTSQVLPADLQTRFISSVETKGLEIVSNMEVYQQAQAGEYPQEISNEIVSLYDTTRENAFQLTMVLVAFACVVGFLVSKNLPKLSLAELSGDGLEQVVG